ncbi:unnamed protein product [Adineta steineri]|uniref:Enkurin domain-containing protein n=1 Tax=Adineta steineri TaxID=433720 RepID=A0A815T8V0_9BILA|nr:unnamed protein product [Adineta steineri]
MSIPFQFKYYKHSETNRGLKKQWEDVHHEFQTLSVIIDTIPKRLHKERLEHEMKLLEKDIDLLEKHQVIYIAD